MGAAAAAVQVRAAARQLRSVLHVSSLWVQAERNWDDGSRGDCSPGCQHRSCCTNTGTVPATYGSWSSCSWWWYLAVTCSRHQAAGVFQHTQCPPVWQQQRKANLLPHY